ncbi:MAG: Flp pilus assembly complex ATPase component TadA [Clostridia bacterium]|nr:Flp pilus assembly complex ATPase component TadA [Clostridia bacterium]
MDAFGEIIGYFPYEDKKLMKAFSSHTPTEIRVRIGRRTKIRWIGGEAETGEIAAPRDLMHLISRMLDHSVYAWEDELGQGYFTLTGGVRVGVSGKFVKENGKTRLVTPTSLLIRIAHEVKGCAKPVMPFLLKDGAAQSVLFLSPPGMGKTTLLRDACRLLSKAGKEICVADERGEIAAMKNGENQLDVGERTDVCEGLAKAQAMLMMIRSMSPDVIAADEIGSEEDAYAIAEAARMGVKVIASAHAASVQDALNRPMIAEILASGAFQYACVLGQSPGHILKVHAFSEGKWLQTSLSESL